jgi:hypothetical protein
MAFRQVQKFASVTLSLALAFGPVEQVLTAQTTTAKPATTKPPVSAGATPAEIDPWPREYTTKSKARVTVYQPQISSWANQKHMVAFAALSYSPADGKTKPTLGTITLEADTRVSIAERLVSFADLKVSTANIPNLDKDRLRETVEEITESIPREERVIALDRVLAAVDKSTIIPKNTPGLKNDPPVIFFSSTPAVLVNIDGDVVWSPIDKNDLKFAINTNWDLFSHEPTKTFYLRDNQTWYKASDIKGPWTPAGKLPQSFSSLPADENFKDVKSNVPGKSVSEKSMPKVFVSTTPAEMILLRGAPSYLSVGKSQLLWVSNTESDVFRMGTKGSVYYLVAGRWFSAPDFQGPWTFASTNLPADFKQIPLEHERSRVLASVPGTDQAAEAVLLAQVPQTARVSKKNAQPEQVTYHGDPQFQVIESTSVQRAINTDKDIFKVGNDFYYCYQGVWFTGKSASGPWTVATTVPAEIYKIPASSPSHHVTYVVVEEDDDDDDEWVTFAAVAGYTGLMIGFGCAVWGSGYYYPPYWGYGGYYPIYYPHYGGYGYSAWYNPWTGGYGRSAVAYGPYGGAGVGARYNPRTGTYARGAAAWGPYGASGYAQAYNPRTGAVGQTRQGSNVYGSWGSTQVQRGDDWASTNRVTNRATGTTTRVTRTDQGAAISRNPAGAGNAGFVAAGEGGNIYAGNDGNVYRRDEGGGWQKYDNGNWGNVDRPEGGTGAATQRAGQGATAGTTSSTYGQLERDRAARTSGTQRTNDYGSVRSNPTPRSYGSYRGGGGARGGGGRRR